MLALYRRLLILYPYAYLRKYGDEMISVFYLAQQDARRQSAQARALFYVREFGGLIRGALRERLHHEDWDLLRRFDMRPEFRFPRSAILLMSVLFGTILFAVEKMRTIAVQHSVDPGAVPNWLFLFSRVFVMGAVFTCVTGLIGYGILFVLRRSGMHRFSDIQTWIERR